MIKDNAAGMYILYILVVSVFRCSLLTILHRCIGEIKYPINELIKIRLANPIIFMLEISKNGVIKE